MKNMTPEELIEKQGQAWEDANCGELWKAAKSVYSRIIEPYVPDTDKLKAVKDLLKVLEYSSGCTGLVWKD